MKRYRINWTRLIITTLVLVCTGLTIYNLYSLHKVKAEINDLSIETTETEQVLDEVEKVSVIEEKEPLSTEERDLVCRVVSAEARGEDLQGQMAVAQVIRDRSELWDMTLTEVVTAPNQFASPYKGKISDKTYLAVANVFDGGMRVFEGNTTHFHDDSIELPYWAENKTNRGKIGRLKFYGGY